MVPQPAPEPSTSSVPPAAIGELQSQLQKTQNSLNGYADKFHLLDSLIFGRGGLKHDTESIKQLMEERLRPENNNCTTRSSPVTYDDDARSVGTTVLHELGRVGEEDGEAAAKCEDRRQFSRRGVEGKVTSNARGASYHYLLLLLISSFHYHWVYDIDNNF
jgi:hypothetical protein